MTSLLPPNATALERGLEAAASRAAAIPVALRDLWNPATCPVDLLPWLAWSLSIDIWDPAWPEPFKRARVAQAIEIQRLKGTLASVRAIVSLFGGSIALREWWETVPQGDPHTFNLVLSLASTSAGPPAAGLLEQGIDEITLTKPLRSHFTFAQALDAAGAIGLTGAARAATFSRLTMAAAAA
jgi:phage tail P2-like protein